MVSWSTVLRLIYSLLVVDSAISVCILDAHEIGHPDFIIKYTNPDFAVIMSWIEVFSFQSPKKTISANTKKLWLRSGCKIRPIWQVPRRYCLFYFTASAWDFFGLAAKQVHWCTAKAKLGHVDFSRKFCFPLTDLQSQYSLKASPSESFCSRCMETAIMVLLMVLLEKLQLLKMLFINCSWVNKIIPFANFVNFMPKKSDMIPLSVHLKLFCWRSYSDFSIYPLFGLRKVTLLMYTIKWLVLCSICIFPLHLRRKHIFTAPPWGEITKCFLPAIVHTCSLGFLDNDCYFHQVLQSPCEYQCTVHILLLHESIQ